LDNCDAGVGVQWGAATSTVAIAES
jgi:hypothetical protein